MYGNPHIIHVLSKFPTAVMKKEPHPPAGLSLPVQKALQQLQCHAPGVVRVARLHNGTEGGDASAV